MKILGIETSCDETATAIVDMAERKVVANCVYSQISEHEEFGGVVPEIASRAHMERLPAMVEKALKEADLTLNDIDAFAATAGPGLLGGLLVGLTYAKSLALGTNKPYLAVNHLEAHALTAHLTETIDFPYLLLLVSGGHCQFIQVDGLGEYKTLGGTLDDAVGECFDKTAKLIGLPYPGGPNIERYAQKGDPKAFGFPIPLNDGSVNFSFSGLKTAVRNTHNSLRKATKKDLYNIAASFQETVAKILEIKAKKALETTGCTQFVLAGGVAANRLLRERLSQLCEKSGVNFYVPPVKLCTDNAVMVAYAGGLRFEKGQQSQMVAKATPRWPLDDCRL